MNKAKRVQLIQVARKALGLDEDSYRAILRDYGGAESATALDDRGFAMVMDRFRHLGFVSDKRKAAYSPNDRQGMASAAQIALIRELWGKLSRDGTDAALDKWIGRFGVSALRFVDAERARRIVGALKAWEARKGQAFNPRVFEDHAKGLRVVDRSGETGPAFCPLDDKFVSQTATSIEVDNSQAKGDPIDFDDGDAPMPPCL